MPACRDNSRPVARSSSERATGQRHEPPSCPLLDRGRRAVTKVRPPVARAPQVRAAWAGGNPLGLMWVEPRECEMVGTGEAGRTRTELRRVLLPLALAQFICSFAGSNMNVMINDI